jgi:hypothetical protein
MPVHPARQVPSAPAACRSPASEFLREIDARRRPASTFGRGSSRRAARATTKYYGSDRCPVSEETREPRGCFLPRRLRRAGLRQPSSGRGGTSENSLAGRVLPRCSARARSPTLLVTQDDDRVAATHESHTAANGCVSSRPPRADRKRGNQGGHMTLRPEIPSAAGAAFASRRCPICAGPVVSIASRKHRRVRCTECGADVPPAQRSLAGLNAARARDDRRTATRAGGRTLSVRPSLARGINRDIEASAR